MGDNITTYSRYSTRVSGASPFYTGVISVSAGGTFIPFPNAVTSTNYSVLKRTCYDGTYQDIQCYFPKSGFATNGFMAYPDADATLEFDVTML